MRGTSKLVVRLIFLANPNREKGKSMSKGRARRVPGLPHLLLFLVLISGAFAPLCACAADAYPSRRLTIIVPYGAGGSYDVLARLIGQKIGEQTGQQVVVDNRLGAAGRIGMEAAVKSPSDGYTLVTVGNSQVIAPSVYLSVPYDLRSMSAIAAIGTITNTLLVNPTVPAHTVAELVALAKANPGKLLFGSGGTGGITHLAGELFKSSAGIDIGHVPFKTGSLAVTAQIGNELQINVVNLLTSLPHIQAGRLRALGVTGLNRSPYLPAMPTLDEQGIRGYDIQEFHTLFAPAGTPSTLLVRLNEEINKALASPQVKDRMAQQAAEVLTMTPDRTRAYVLAEQDKYANIVKTVGIKPD